MRNRGQFAEAEKAWSKAIEIDPTYFLGYTYRAGLYDEQNWQVARQAFLKAESIRSSSAYQMMIMITYIKEKKLLDAKNYAQKCMKTMTEPLE